MDLPPHNQHIHKDQLHRSSPASDGRGRRDVPVSSPTVQESQQRTSPTPAPSENRFFMDWSSIRTGSPLVRMPPQSILVRERGHEINQTTIQTSQPGSEPTQMGVTENTLQEDLPSTTPLAQQQPLDRLSMMDERRMNDVGINTSDVVVEPARDRLRTSTVEANAQTSIPIVDIMLPSGQGDHLTIPHVNLSISGYELDLLRTSNMRFPSMWAQEISIMPQLDGPGSLLMRDPIGQRHMKFLGWLNGNPLKETYIQRTTTTRGREYREEDSGNDGSRRPCRNQRPLDEERYPNQGGRPPD